NVDILVPNEVEARALTGVADPRQAAGLLRERGIESVIVTLGKRGALLVDGQGIREIAPFEVEAVDSTAAGDAFVGALAAALARERAIDEAAYYASAAGALAVTVVGAQPSLPTLGAVESLIALAEGRPPVGYPEERHMSFRSNRGDEILIRPILPTDAPRLKQTFDELSPESVYRRFFSHRRNLTDNEARSLATVDYHNSFALVAAPATQPERLIGVARFAPSPERGGAVEMAIVIIDAFQHQGIGRALFRELADTARDLGHHWMLIETQSDNQAMADLATSAGHRTETGNDGMLLRIWLDLQGPRET
ncbi:MAG: PfkB family carbohydrate kinase, partial [Ardenticatenaceae bacterium]